MGAKIEFSSKERVTGRVSKNEFVQSIAESKENAITEGT